MIGKILGNRYELLQCVGEGGMSFVYKARCRKLNRFVAVKILKDEFKNNEEIVRRFKKEATAIANLSNPNVVNVLDVGTQDDINYIVMEYVEGKTLKDIIKEKGPLPYEVAISIGIKVAKALECAHRSGIIHRDVKPQNILVTEEGVVKVTDFGIAKSMDSSTIAHTNSVMGSAHYFSPEQAKGTYTDYRTDLYSLGIVLYEMVTGVVPFNGDSPVTVAVKHIQEQAIPPKSINKNIPDSLNDLIMKAIEKDPVNRYQTAKEMITDLEKIKKDPNATILSKKEEEENQFTKVMSPVVLPNNEVKSEDFDDYDEDEDEEDDEDEDNQKEEDSQNNIKKRSSNKKSPIVMILCAVLAIALLGTIGVVGVKKMSENKEVTIPNVVGQKQDVAKKELEKLGLKVVEVTEESDEEKGVVLKVEPEVGASVKKKSEVKLVVSGGPEQVKVPDLTNMNLESVKRTLNSLGLELGDVSEDYSDSVAKGEVISQNPNKDESVDKGSKINVILSKGVEIKTKLIDVPNVSGKSVDEAKSILANLGVSVNAVKGDAANSQGEVGKVYAQSQVGGITIKEGETLTITISYYGEPAKAKFNAGDLVGMTGSEARNWAANHNVTVNGITSDSLKITSVSHNTVEEGGSVSVTMEKPKNEKPVEPPKDENKNEEKPKPEEQQNQEHPNPNQPGDNQ